MRKYLITLLVLAYLFCNTHTYSGLNKGVYVDFYPTHYSVGFEYVGTVGFFACDTDC